MGTLSDVDKFKAMMAQTDNTSKFVGFFLLLQILSDSPSAALECWTCIDQEFLDKLVLSKRTKSTTQEEATDLKTMGCSVLRAFSGFEQVASTSKFIKRSDALMKLYLRETSEEDHAMLGESLLRIASSRDGAAHILSSDVFVAFASKSIDQSWPAGYSILGGVLSQSVSMEDVTADLFHERIRDIVERVVRVLDTHTLSPLLALTLLTDITSAVTPDRIGTYLNPAQIDVVRDKIKSLILKPVKGESPSSTLVLFASLLRVSGQDQLIKDNTQQETQFFGVICALASTEIRSSLAPMVNQVQAADYYKTTIKVASCFDIVRIACLHLVTSETLELQSDDILKIRDNFSAVFGEVVSYLRDRWDQSPLCPTLAWHVGTKTLQNKESEAQLLLDPTILSGTQALAMWLTEDESMHKDACGIMDVLLGLVKEGRKVGIDYESWIVPAIEALFESEKGQQQFKHFGGAKIIPALG